MSFCLDSALGHTWKAALEGCETIHVRIILFWEKEHGLGRTGLPRLEPWACHHVGQHLLASSSWAGNTIPAAVPAAGQEIHSLAASIMSSVRAGNASLLCQGCSTSSCEQGTLAPG